MARIDNRNKLIILILVASYFALMLLLMLTKYYDFKSDWPLDLALGNQAIWKTKTTSIESLLRSEYDITLFKADTHEWFILSIISPFYYIWPFPETLLIIKALSFSLAIIPVYLLSKKLIRNKHAFWLSIATYMCSGGVLMVLLNDFFPITLGLPFFLFAYYFQFAKKPLPFLIFSILTISCRKEMVFPIFMIFVSDMIRRKLTKFSFMALGVCITYLAYGLLLMPEKIFNLDYYITQIFLYPRFSSPSWTLLVFSIGFLLPSAIYTIFSRKSRFYGVLIYLVFVLIASLELKHWTNFTFIVQFTHIASIVLPLIIIDGVFSLADIQSKISETTFKYALFFFLICSVIIIEYMYDSKLSPQFSEPEREDLWNMIKLIPENASVVADKLISPQLSSREKLVVYNNGYPVKFSDYEYALIEQKDIGAADFSNWHIAFSSNTHMLLKRLD